MLTATPAHWTTIFEVQDIRQKFVWRFSAFKKRVDNWLRQSGWSVFPKWVAGFCDDWLTEIFWNVKSFKCVGVFTWCFVKGPVPFRWAARWWKLGGWVLGSLVGALPVILVWKYFWSHSGMEWMFTFVLNCGDRYSFSCSFVRLSLLSAFSKDS